MFDTTALIANDKDLDINERFKPFISIVETMPDDKFKDTGFMSEKRLLTVTVLIKNSIELNRGDFANQLIEGVFPKLAKNQPEFIVSTSETGSSIREEISDITEKATILSKKHYSESAIDKTKPLTSLLALIKNKVMLEFEGDDESMPADTPITGNTPATISAALHTLRNGNRDLTKDLIEVAIVNKDSEVLKSYETFNGMDKSILNSMTAQAKKILEINKINSDTKSCLIDPNPLNTMIAKFLSLYEGGHFAKGGGFSKECDDLDRYDVKMDSLPKIVKLMNSQDTNRIEVTGLSISRRLKGEVTRDEKKPTEFKICDFKKVYDEANGDLDAMRKIFNDTHRFPPKPFEVKIKPGMSKQQVSQKARLAALGGGSSATASIGGNVG